MSKSLKNNIKFDIGKYQDSNFQIWGWRDAASKSDLRTIRLSGRDALHHVRFELSLIINKSVMYKTLISIYHPLTLQDQLCDRVMDQARKDYGLTIGLRIGL